MNWLLLGLAWAAAIAGVASFNQGWAIPSLSKGGMLQSLNKKALLHSTTAFTLAHMLAPFALGLPIAWTHYGWHALFTLLGCYAASYLGYWFISLPWGGTFQYVRASLIAGVIILLFDYANLLLLFHDLLRWQPELVLLTCVLVFLLCFATLRMLAFIRHHREERRRTPVIVPGLLLAGTSLFAIPLLCAISLLPAELLGSEHAYLLPYALLLLVGSILYVLPDLSVAKAQADGVTVWNLAYRDELTDLPNRRSFNEALDTCMRPAGGAPAPLTLFFIDLDKFKRVNDLLGHVTGDEVLRIAADKLRSCLPPQAMLSRMGGDEFTVLLPGKREDREIHELADLIVEQFQTPIKAGPHLVRLSASVGIARCPEEGVDASTLLHHADAAMYTAKENGSAQYQFFDQLRSQNGQRELMLEQDLAAAIENGELRVFYQPKIDIRDGSTIGLEALVRWHHPVHGLISPLQFIPLAEKLGLIVPLERWVINEVCQQSRQWQDTAALHIPIAINISQVHLMQPDVYEYIIESAGQAGIDRQGLEIEITESAMMHNEEHVIEVLNRLKAAGIHVSMDDFGTGYSSLSYLSSLPISCLKIDRSFISKLASDSDNRAIAELIVGMAKQLGLQIVAEGVETSEQVNLLKDLQCYNAQGYYYGKPLPPEQALLRMLDSVIPSKNADLESSNDAQVC